MIKIKIDGKLIGGILLVVGTAIGGGMLALPIATSETGFISSQILLVVCWMIMTLSAFLLLEVNLALPTTTNIISMVKIMLGKWGAIVAWISYLLLFYSVIAAYMTGGGDFLQGLLKTIGLPLPNWVAIIFFAGLLGSIVYQGIHYVDYFNRALMSAKLGTFLLLVVVILAFVSSTKLLQGHLRYFLGGATVTMASFTFANIIPSLRTYFNDDIKKLRKAIFIGSLIPLICYFLWDLAIMGFIPREGEGGLINILHSHHSTSDFINQLSFLSHNGLITLLARVFTSICLATSFLTCSLGLSDFLADGLKLEKKGQRKLIIFAATFLPPFTVVIFYPGAFINALSYAGIYCVILFVLFPSLMAWRLRYSAQMAYLRTPQSAWQLKGGKFLLVMIFFSALLTISYGFWQTYFK